MMSTARTVEGSKATSTHWPFSVFLPSCQHVRRLPSMTISGWNFARLPTTDEAVAPVAASGTPAGSAVGSGDAPGSLAPGSADPLAPAPPGVASAPVDGPGLRSTTPATTMPTPNSPPNTTMARIHLAIPPDRPVAAGSGRVAVPAVTAPGRALGVAATAAAICSLDGSVMRAVSTRRVPHDWQNVRVAAFAMPHPGQRSRASEVTGTGADTRDVGASTGPRVTGGTTAVAASGAHSSAGRVAGTTASPASPAVEPGARTTGGAVSVASPSHSRNAPHEPQNWSPPWLAKPQRRQITPAPSVMTPSPADGQQEGEVDELQDPARRAHRRLRHEHRGLHGRERRPVHGLSDEIARADLVVVEHEHRDAESPLAVGGDDGHGGGDPAARGDP